MSSPASKMIGQAQSQVLLNQLLDAEKKAESIVDTAKKNRLTLLKQASKKAEEEIKAYKVQADAKFAADSAAKNAQDPAAALADKTLREVKQVHNEYEINKDKAIKFVASKVLEVQCSLSTTQKQALSANAM